MNFLDLFGKGADWFKKLEPSYMSYLFIFGVFFICIKMHMSWIYIWFMHRWLKFEESYVNIQNEYQITFSRFFFEW